MYMVERSDIDGQINRKDNKLGREEEQIYVSISFQRDWGQEVEGTHTRKL